MKLLRTLRMLLSWLQWVGLMWFVLVEKICGGATIRSIAVSMTADVSQRNDTSTSSPHTESGILQMVESFQSIDISRSSCAQSP